MTPEESKQRLRELIKNPNIKPLVKESAKNRLDALEKRKTINK